MKPDTKRLVVFLAVVFVLTFAYEFAVVVPMARSCGYGSSPTLMALVALCMFFPSIAVVITRLITREGFKDAKIRPHFKGNRKPYLLAWFAFPVITAVGAAAYFLLFPDRFDPNSGYILQQSTAAGTPVPENLRMFMFSQLAVGVLFGPVLNCVATFGEEWGWRGYMMPKLLARFSFPTACLIGGVVWGLWHAPMIAVGHNYGTEYVGAPWLGIALMCVFCITTGTILTWWCVKVDSCIPAVIGHASLNAIAGAGLYFAADNSHTLVGPSPCGAVGLAILSAITVWIMIRSRGTNPQCEGVRKRGR